MFLALAIVCDEFFVPALDVLVERIGISNDVAGATFMAAGGSAPELFTSLIGTFQESSVGFGTIVGSAVFNVLFVIAMCAIFSHEPLKLTWWPLARDCTYYALALLVLAVFFGAVADLPTDEISKRGPCDQSSAIWYWESLVLLVMYVGYVLVMKMNAALRSRFDKSLDDVTIIPDDPEGALTLGALVEPTESVQNKNRPGFAGFRAGMLTLLVEQRPVNTAMLEAVHRIKGDVKATFAALDQSNDGFIDKKELRQLLRGLGLPTDLEDSSVSQILAEIEKEAKHWDGTRPEEVSLGEFTDWYVTSEQRIEADLCKTFSRVDQDGNGVVNRSELNDVFRKMGHSPSEEDMAQAWADLDSDHSGDVSKEEFARWYRESIWFSERHKLDEVGVDEEEGLSLAWPEGCRSRIMYVVTLPLLIFMLGTMPDVRRDSRKKYFVFTFVMAIVHIGIYSYLMVWFATDVGCALKIPDAVMGLTFLAAGTSVPDLLTSVIVAKQGHGDMAVSSSIGSNIFDVLVGLPLPWLIFAVYKGASSGETFQGGDGPYVSVAAPTLFVSLLILFAMIALVIGTIVINKWTLTKSLGTTMIIFYILFVGQDLSRTFEWPELLYGDDDSCE
jgi:K+-dependent Na+/Ca+ exchanger-like protein